MSREPDLVVLRVKVFCGKQYFELKAKTYAGREFLRFRSGYSDGRIGIHCDSIDDIIEAATRQGLKVRF